MPPTRPDEYLPCSGPIHRPPLAAVAHRSRPPKVARSGTKLAPRSGAVTRQPNSIVQCRGAVELEPEVTAWLDGLADDEFGHLERDIDLPADQGALLGEPFT